MWRSACICDDDDDYDDDGVDERSFGPKPLAATGLRGPREGGTEASDDSARDLIQAPGSCFPFSVLLWILSRSVLGFLKARGGVWASRFVGARAPSPVLDAEEFDEWCSLETIWSRIVSRGTERTQGTGGGGKIRQCATWLLHGKMRPSRACSKTLGWDIGGWIMEIFRF